MRDVIQWKPQVRMYVVAKLHGSPDKIVEKHALGLFGTCAVSPLQPSSELCQCQL